MCCKVLPFIHEELSVQLLSSPLLSRYLPAVSIAAVALLPCLLPNYAWAKPFKWSGSSDIQTMDIHSPVSYTHLTLPTSDLV